MRVEIWSDVVCPWCYIGRRRFERAMEAFEHRNDVEVVWRSYELDSHAPRERGGGYVERLARKYGTTSEGAQAMVDRMVQAGAVEGLEMRFDIARPGNTFDAHRLLHLARTAGLQPTLGERLFAATFTEGRPIGEHATLQALAVDAGLDADRVRSVLDSEEFAQAVREDERDAQDLDVTGVPFFAFDRRYGLGGAQDPQLLLKVLRRAWDERSANLSA